MIRQKWLFFKNEEVEMETRYRERAVNGNTIDLSIFACKNDF